MTFRTHDPGESASPATSTKPSGGASWPLLAVLLLLFLTWSAASARAQLSLVPDTSEQEQVPFGIYISSIHDLDFFKGSVEVAFWAWWVYDAEDYVPHEQIELVNAAAYTIETTVRRRLEDGSRYLSAKFVATLRQNWDLTHFPFDRQRLRITIESAGLRAHQLQYLADIENSMVNQDLVTTGWEILGLNLIQEEKAYATSFGVTGEKPSVYPRITAEIVIKRRNITLFLSVFIGFFVAFVITTLHFFLDVLPLQPRINMLIGSVFAAIGNKYIIDTNYPPPESFSLSETIATATFLVVAFAFLVTVLCAKLIQLEKKPLADRINRSAAAVMVPIYLVVVGQAIYRAVTSG